MQQEKDYIKREVEKVILFIKKLTEKISDKNLTFLEVLPKIQEDFENFFQLSFSEIITLNNVDFIKKLEGINIDILKEMIQLLHLIINKNQTEISQKAIIEKTVLLIDFIDEKEKIFSLERTQLKQQLKTLI